MQRILKQIHWMDKSVMFSVRLTEIHPMLQEYASCATQLLLTVGSFSQTASFFRVYPLIYSSVVHKGLLAALELMAGL